jgi:hypothetical protein
MRQNMSFDCPTVHCGTATRISSQKSPLSTSPSPARAGNRRFGLLSAQRTHTKAPYKPDLLWPLNRPGRARTVPVRDIEHLLEARAVHVALLGVGH